VVALAASDAKSAVYDPPSPWANTILSGTTPSGLTWNAVSTGTALPVRTSATSSFNGAPGTVVYFNVVTGQLQVNPRGYDLNSLIITFTTGTVNIGSSTPGPFTYATGTGENAYSPSTGTPRTLPAKDPTTAGLAPVTFASRVGLTIGQPLSASLSSTGDPGNIASTGTLGFWNMGWSFPLNFVASGSVESMAVSDFKTIGQNSNANANILGYGLGACTFQYGINGVTGTQVGAVVPVFSVPEPSTYVMALAGLACGGWQMFRRRKLASSLRLLLLCAVIAIAVGRSSTPTLAQSVNYELVPVGNPGNANDTTGYGRVAYEYRIGKYEVTIGQYCEFLNAVAATDTYGLYSGWLAYDQRIAGIEQTGSPGAFSYSVLGPAGVTPSGAASGPNRPITSLNWLTVARFANWMANGQPFGAQDASTTENGAYTLSGSTAGVKPGLNTINPNTQAPPSFYIPLENEWYKAAYFSPALNSGAGGYWSYATQSNSPPGNNLGGASNQANVKNGVYSVTQSGSSAGQNYLSDVGAFSGSPSFYGTFDQSGNVYEYNGLDGGANTSVSGCRGGSFPGDALIASSAYRFGPGSTGYPLSFHIGFRLAAPVAVPEPSTYAMALAGLAFGGYSMFRRRRA
jgi:formylglycine-generating enzyme required for sulfatase activity